MTAQDLPVHTSHRFHSSILLEYDISGTVVPPGKPCSGFSVHPTEPESLEQSIECARVETADVGIALYGDGDRLGVVDGRGRILWTD